MKAKEFRTKNTVALARGLLGQVLVRTFADGRQSRHVITEVEAYHGERDRASHASRGRTGRNAPMFAPGGVWYVYLCYGMHEMLNLVTGPRDFPAAVLIRGIAGLAGPGRLTKALGIDRRLDGAPAAPVSGLHLEVASVRVPRRLVRSAPRIGVDYAGPEWAAKPWRFFFDPAFPRMARMNADTERQSGCFYRRPRREQRSLTADGQPMPRLRLASADERRLDASESATRPALRSLGVAGNSKP